MARPHPEDRHSYGGLSHFLGERVAALSWKDLPAEAVRWAKVGILDTVGVTLAGSREEAPRLLAGTLDLAPGPSVLFGFSKKVQVLDAALINGTSSHALDFDDTNNTMGGHPSVPVLSALFALADETGSSGRDFITAYVAGFEAECKIALAVNFHHYTKGWHPTATLGTFGAAAGAARLLNLSGGQTAVALALAASFASGLKANFGTMAKPLHVGHCARNGILAARLAKVGFTANKETVFEHEQGFLDVFNGPGTYDTQRAMEAWAAPLDIVKPGIGIKQYPCCASTHPAIDAMLQIRRIDPADVERIDARIHTRRLKHTNRPRPASGLDAKFSLQYVLARALVDRAVRLAHFENETWRDPRIAALLPRIHVAPYEGANHFAGEVRITLSDGSIESARVEQPLGRTSDNPIPPERLRRKFELCAQGVLADETIGPVADAIAAIETLPNMRSFTEKL